MRTALMLLLACFTAPCVSQDGAAVQPLQSSPRFHAYAGLGLSSSRATSHFISILSGEGYYVRQSRDLFEDRRTIGQGTGTFLQADYSVVDRARLGVAIVTLGRIVGGDAYAGGDRHVVGPGWTTVQTVLRASTIGYYAQGSYAFLQHAGERGLDLHGGIGFGYNEIHIEYGCQTEYVYDNEFRDMPTKMTDDETAYGALLFANLEFWSSASLSVCLNIAYRYIPMQSISAVTVDAGTYTDYTVDPPVQRLEVVRFPEARISVSNVLYGLMIGVHF